MKKRACVLIAVISIVASISGCTTMAGPFVTHISYDMEGYLTVEIGKPHE